jgi:ionotropic glutamate receptor
MVGLPLVGLIWVFLNGCVYCQTPASVNIGAIFTFNSVIGRATRVAMKAAVSDVNADPKILKGIKLNLMEEDENCSAFMGSVGGNHGIVHFVYFFFSLKHNLVRSMI